jgi:hypothetical protein
MAAFNPVPVVLTACSHPAPPNGEELCFHVAMRLITPHPFLPLLFLPILPMAASLGACHSSGGTKPDDSSDSEETAVDSSDSSDSDVDSTDSTETGDSTDSTDTVDTSDSAHTGETGDSTDTVDTADTSEPLIGPVSVAIHSSCNTILVVSWSLAAGADETWVEYSFLGEAPMSSPHKSATAGDHSVSLLGIPSETDVTFQVVASVDGVEQRSDELTGTTGALPAELPLPTLLSWDTKRASPEGWIISSVGLNPRNWYDGRFAMFAMDRQARVVWYYLVPGHHATMHPKISKDGTHVIFEETSLYTGDYGAGSHIYRLGLDFAYDHEIDLTGLGSTFTENDEGTIYFDDYSAWPLTELGTYHSDGSREIVWTCNDWMDTYTTDPYACDPNETIWVSSSNTVIWSMWEVDTAVEVDVEAGEVLRQWGGIPGSWAFDPEDASFEMQHFPHYTDDGTLLVSTHQPGTYDAQFAREYIVDDASETLEEIWSYEAAGFYPTYAGEAQRVENGDTLINYGTDGAAREVTTDGDVVWEVEWSSTYILGHFNAVTDLYALAPEADD